MSELRELGDWCEVVERKRRMVGRLNGGQRVVNYEEVADFAGTRAKFVGEVEWFMNGRGVGAVSTNGVIEHVRHDLGMSCAGDMAEVGQIVSGIVGTHTARLLVEVLDMLRPFVAERKEE
jgi:hypothetical protein